MNKQASCTCTIGILLCGEVRDFLKKAQFLNYDITFFEGNGWIERDFIVKGNKKHVEMILKSLREWADED